MRKKKAIVAGGLGGLSLVIVFAGLVSVRTLCACATVDQTFGTALGPSPMHAPSDFRVKLLEKLPPGSTIDEMYLLLGRVARTGSGGLEPQGPVDFSRDEDVIRMKRRCAINSGEFSCRFVVMEEWWALKKTGFDLHATLDGANRLKDLRVARFSEWGMAK